MPYPNLNGFQILSLVIVICDLMSYFDNIILSLTFILI